MKKKKKYSAILIDDEKPALEVLVYLIQKYCPQIVIGATSSILKKRKNILPRTLQT